MWKLVIILSCAASALCAALPKYVCPANGRIVGGSANCIDQFPWQVSLQYKGRHYCGGAIYDKVTIITAAHCVISQDKYLTIRAGSSYWNSGGVVRTVIHVIHHRWYNTVTNDYDIAILRLDSPLVFNEFIYKIMLAEVEPPHGTGALVSGWGDLEYGSNQPPTHLQAVVLPIVNRTECASSKYKYGNRITGRMICTYSENKDSCQGDSGGPLITTYDSAITLVGVVSWGTGCGWPDYPGVYASVAALRGWILMAVDEMNTLFPNT